MMTLWNRVNAVFFFSISALMALGALSSVTTLWLPPRAVVRTLRVTKLAALREQRTAARAEPQDRAILRFDIDADLTGVFNWNVKQLFAFVSATYATPTNAFAEVVIWDAIVPNVSAARLLGTDVLNKYPLVDQRAELRGADVALRLHWDVMPITGVLKRGDSGPMTRVRLPDAYCQEGCELRELPPAAGAAAAAAGDAGGKAPRERTAANWHEEIDMDDL